MNAKTPRQLKKAQTKATLMKAAYEIFSQKGIQGTRMSDIAAAANVSHGTVFLHFNTQEAFIAEVVEFYCSQIALRTHELSDSCRTLKELLSAHLDGISDYEPFYTRLVIENRMLPSEARDAYITVQSAVSYHFSKAFEKEDISFIPTDILFNMWMGLVHYYLSNGDLFAPEGNVISRYRNTLIDSFLALLEKENNQAH